MPFFSKKKAPSIETAGKGHNPYLNARQEWLERYGGYISRAAQWRTVAFFCLIITGISITGNVIQANQVKTIPYIIEVDKLGKSAVVARADVASVTPQRLIQSEIAACVADWRTVTADVELQKKMISRLSYFMAGSAKGVLKEWYETNNPYEIAKSGKLVHVEIKSLPLPVSADSYRVEWTETVRSHAGALLEQHTYEATATIQINPPQTDAVLLRNPGGIYITALSAGKVVGAPSRSSSGAVSGAPAQTEYGKHHEKNNALVVRVFLRLPGLGGVSSLSGSGWLSSGSGIRFAGSLGSRLYQPVHRAAHG